ncbi:hypothetical protein ACPOL_4112 [Acidisarcina polymorpha]|uniref:Outer membrane lipoprotein-sorting protein n=1 Tax=Acidisarcina polymorpha TaxID=2211140 RepID=A0A2Z5G2V9_9BACT|nr:hypothetical protein [Acidisarcina polymorpha]AXC13389.1 hypothetical protein ACPOL_4112 [Acidisarcina polymorpha]
MAGRLRGFFLGAALLAATSVAALAQVSYTPMPMDQGFGPLDKAQPAIPPDQIIAKFTAKESAFRQALNNYVYRRSVKVQTVDDDGKVDGEYYELTDVAFDSTGRRTEHVLQAPASTLERIMMSPADFADIQQRLPFVLTQEDVGQYNVTYVGKQKVDELDTYVFDVAPKVMEKKHRYFQGKIWVDTQDLQIVVTNGKNVPDDTRKGHEDLSPPFVTYREEIDGKYWFPVYTKGDGILHFSGGSGYISQDVHIREFVKYTDYRQFKSTVKVTYDGQDIGNGSGNKPDGSSQPAPQQQTPPATPPEATPPK